MRRNNLKAWLVIGAQPVPITAHDGELKTGSAISPTMRGKAPGLRVEGTERQWVGFPFLREDRRYPRYMPELQEMSAADGGVGLIGGETMVAADIDILHDPGLAVAIRDKVISICGWAPVRIGQAPKCLLLYRVPKGVLPYSTRMLRWKFPGGREGGFELIGKGRQFVVDGIHPKTLTPYVWDTHPLDCEDLIGELRPEMIPLLIEAVRGLVEAAGGELVTSETRHGHDGALAPAQATLEGPEELVLSALAAIPNAPETTREQWLEVGYALKAAAGRAWSGKALAAWIDWSDQWVPPAGGTPNSAEECERNWARMKGPFWLGAEYLYSQAKRQGWKDSLRVVQAAFAADPLPADELVDELVDRHNRQAQDEAVLRADLSTDRTMATLYLEERGAQLLHVEDAGSYRRYDGMVWVPLHDPRLVADIAQWMGLHGARYFPPGTKENDRTRANLQSQPVISRVTKLVKAMCRRINSSALGARTDVLVTPAGTIELVPGLPMRPNDQNDMQTAMAQIAPAPRNAGPPVRFLETLGYASWGVKGALDYVQLALGNALLGNPAQIYLAFWGPGRNGKSTVLEVLLGILGDSHDNGLATSCKTKMWQESVEFTSQLLGGRRVAVTSEMDGSAGWNEELLKSVTGGDTLQVRNLFERYAPQRSRCMPIFAFNSPPRLRDVTPAIRRRSAVIAVAGDDDGRLAIPANKRQEGIADRILQAEGPRVLRWMLDGAERVLAGESAAIFPDDVAAGADRMLGESDMISAWLLGNLIESEGTRIALATVVDAMHASVQALDDDEERQRLLAIATSRNVSARARRLGFTVMRGAGGSVTIVGRRMRRKISDAELDAMTTGKNVEAFEQWTDSKKGTAR